MPTHDNSPVWTQEGRDAAARGDHDCPYFPGTVGAHHWHRGWTEAATAAGASSPVRIIVSAVGPSSQSDQHLRRLASLLRQLGYQVPDETGADSFSAAPPLTAAGLADTEIPY